VSGQPVQTFRERMPPAALTPYVTCLWVQEVSEGPYERRTVPNGSAEIVWRMGAEPQIVGPATGPTVEVLEPGTRVVGVRLRPGAAPSVLGMPASELVDVRVDVKEVWGSAGIDGDAPTAALLERALVRRLSERSELDPAVAEVVRRLHRHRVNEVGSLAAELFLSERQLRRRFEAAVGLPPKALQRFVRFHRFLAVARTFEKPSTRLAELAAATGYADQAHLTREAVRLQGNPPRTLLRETERSCACVHDHSASDRPFLHG
jgi:AraC-like DNA-binding protein